MLRISLSGEIDIATHDELFDSIMTPLRHAGTLELVIDLHGVSFLDSGAVGILVAGHNAATQAECAYHILDPPEPVRRVLQRTGVLDLLIGA
ncbi:MAG: STAS domain-containing protein [Micromonosporaceae bacterium]